MYSCVYLLTLCVYGGWFLASSSPPALLMTFLVVPHRSLESYRSTSVLQELSSRQEAVVSGRSGDTEENSGWTDAWQLDHHLHKLSRKQMVKYPKWFPRLSSVQIQNTMKVSVVTTGLVHEYFVHGSEQVVILS